MNTKTLLSDFPQLSGLARRLSDHPRAVVFLGTIFVVLLAQHFSGAVNRPFFGHPDAPSHAVSSLLVTNYLRDGMPGNPIDYARELYSHYPKISIGYWPPAFYGIAGAWLLLFGISGASFLAFYAVVAGTMALLLWQALQNRLGPRPAVFAVATLLLVAFAGRLLSSTMLELPLALFAFAATLAFARFIRQPTLGNSLLFSLFASISLLTKGNGFFLALLPPFALLLARQWKLAFTWQLWLSAAVVGAITSPWYLHFARTGTSGFSNKSEQDYLLLSLPFYLLSWWQAFGIAAAAFALGGLALVIRRSPQPKTAPSTGQSKTRPIQAASDSAFWAGMAAAVLGFFLFHIAVRSGTEVRYWYTVLGPACALAALGYAKVEALLQRSRFSEMPPPYLVLATLTLLLALSLPLHHALVIPRNITIATAAEWIAQHQERANHTVLVCCSPMAEGEMIATLAFQFPKPGDYLRTVRGSHLQGMTGYHRPMSMNSRMKVLPGPIDFRSLPITAAYVAPPKRLHPLISTPSDDRWHVIAAGFRLRPDLWQHIQQTPGRAPHGTTIGQRVDESFFVLRSQQAEVTASAPQPKTP
jgi:hypothetical protein